jgi:hypothetical protein
MMTEYDFYNNLYDDFLETRNDENNKVLWKMYKILELMKITDKKDSSEFMENGLRMIMLLFNKYDINSCDLSSYDLMETVPDKKEKLLFILKEEFT